MLMTISSSSLGTLVLVPNSSPRACGGVEYSFRGFSEWEDSEGLGLILSPKHVLGMVIPFRRDQTPLEYSREIWWVRKGLS